MALPITPTIDTICTEGLRSVNALEHYARAKSEWIPEIVREMLDRPVDWRVLEATSVNMFPLNTQQIAFPADCKKTMRLRMFAGLALYTVQAGTNFSFTLDPTDTTPQGNIVNRYVFTQHPGTGLTQFALITAVSGSPQVATVVGPWATNPVNGDTYFIANYEKGIPYEPWEDMFFTNFGSIPDAHSIYNSSIWLNTIPNQLVWASVLDYVVDLGLSDLTGPIWTKVFFEWQLPLKLGVAYRGMAAVNKPQSSGGYTGNFAAANQNLNDAYKRYQAAIQQAQVNDLRRRKARRSPGLESIGGMPRGRSV